jgi:hypothetical protein
MLTPEEFEAKKKQIGIVSEAIKEGIFLKIRNRLLSQMALSTDLSLPPSSLYLSHFPCAVLPLTFQGAAPIPPVAIIRDVRLIHV